jgi:hypothetical protein
MCHFPFVGIGLAFDAGRSPGKLEGSPASLGIVQTFKLKIGVEVLVKNGGHAVRSAHAMGRQNPWHRLGNQYLEGTMVS